jgi:glucose/arabinose dehydrogenase
MKRALLAMLVVGAVACADDDDLAEPEGTAPTTTATTTSEAPVTTAAPTEPASTTAGSPESTAAATTAAVAETTTIVSPDIDPAVTFSEVATLDGGVVDLAWRAGDDGLYVVEQAGRVTRLAGDATTVLDITDLTSADGERGLLGLAFDPTGELAYVNYTDNDGATVISEHPVGADGQFGTGDSSRLVLQIEQPYANHNGGDLTFGPDGMLYIGTGDGGSGGDPERRATDLTTLLGKMLRIDPAAGGGEPYIIPADNPFVADTAVSPEIWASGLRNPWRFSFDRETGDLWIADVGQNAIEEIDVAPATGGRDAGKGLSFGWSAFEGDQRFNDDVPAEGHVPPIATYGHDVGCSISGGVRVRGGPVPAMVGWYVYADYCSGQVWALQVTGEGAEIAAGRTVELGQVESPTAVVDGPSGETYVLSANGTVYRLDPA